MCVGHEKKSHYDKDTDRKHRLELRDAKTGKLTVTQKSDSYYTRSSYDNNTNGPMCQISTDAVLTCEFSTGRATEYILTGDKLMPGATVNIPMGCINAIAVGQQGGNSLVFAASSKYGKILAVNFESCKTVWEVGGKEHDGLEIVPEALCIGANGNLYVADSTNCRIVELTSTGQVIGTLYTTDFWISAIAWMAGKRRLVMSDANGMVYVCEVHDQMPGERGKTPTITATAAKTCCVM